MLCSVARASAAAPRAPPTGTTAARSGRLRSRGRATAPCPRAAHSLDGGLQSSAESAAAPWEESRSIGETIADIDALLGVQATVAEAAAAEAVAPASGSGGEAAAVPAEWAHLPAEELNRRQKLVRRRDMLGVRQAELAAAMDQHERKLAYHTQQLRDLRLRKRALEDEQRLVQDSIDPEATAAARLAAAQARAAEEEAELQSRRQFAIGFWGVFVALCAARSHFDSVAADGWLDAPGPFGW